MKEKEYLAFALTFVGFETIAQQEIHELLSKKATIEKGIVQFSATDKEIAELCYRTQALRIVCRQLALFSFSHSLDDFKKQAKEHLKFSDLSLFSEKTFRVNCDRAGQHDFTSNDVAAALGELFLDMQPKTSVRLVNPELFVYCLIEDSQCFIGINFAGFDLSKREYKIYNQANTLNAAFAYCVVRYAGYTGKEVLLDPLSGVGLLPIEASLFATKTSPRLYQKDQFAFQRFFKIDLSSFDKEPDAKKAKQLSLTGYDVHLRNMEAAKKHAKLCNVSKYVTFARGDIEWIDTKVDEKSVDIIVCQAPVEGRAVSEKELEKFYKEFFYQLEFVLKDSGKMILVCLKTALLKKVLQYFTIVDEHLVYQGEQEFVLVTLKKKK